jgi:hypothetical protein
VGPSFDFLVEAEADLVGYLAIVIVIVVGRTTENSTNKLDMTTRVRAFPPAVIRLVDVATAFLPIAGLIAPLARHLRLGGAVLALGIRPSQPCSIGDIASAGSTKQSAATVSAMVTTIKGLLAARIRQGLSGARTRCKLTPSSDEYRTTPRSIGMIAY